MKGYQEVTGEGIENIGQEWAFSPFYPGEGVMCIRRGEKRELG